MKELIDAFANLSLSQDSQIQEIPVYQKADLKGTGPIFFYFLC